jgi:hypothetical protein
MVDWVLTGVLTTDDRQAVFASPICVTDGTWLPTCRVTTVMVDGLRSGRCALTFSGWVLLLSGDLRFILDSETCVVSVI